MLDIGATPAGGAGAPRPVAWSGDGDGARIAAWGIPAAPGALPGFRRTLGGLLDGTSLSADERYDLLLAAGEAASNAVEHALSPRRPVVEVRVEVDGVAVTVVVADSGGWQPQITTAHRGRGLAMMQLLADVSITVSEEGTTVTLRKAWSFRAPRT